jgi:hypothetical protein
LLILLEAYQAMVLKDEPGLTFGKARIGSLEGAHAWLAKSLATIWAERGRFQNLSADAALLVSAIKNWTPVGRTEQAQLVELLRDFLPQAGFHCDYDPALDESVRDLISGRIVDSQIDQTVVDWYGKLSKLSSLLGTMPDHDPTLSR